MRRQSTCRRRIRNVVTVTVTTDHRSFSVRARQKVKHEELDVYIVENTHYRQLSVMITKPEMDWDQNGLEWCSNKDFGDQKGILVEI